MRHLSAAVLIVLLFSLPSCKLFNWKRLFGRKADTMAVWQAEQANIRYADSIRKIHERLSAAENLKIDSARKADEERLARENRYKFNIIVGSFITPEYAKLYAEDYRKQGYNVRIINMPGSKFELVSAEAHENLRTAYERLKEFQDTVQFEAWLYTIR